MHHYQKVREKPSKVAMWMLRHHLGVPSRSREPVRFAGSKGKRSFYGVLSQAIIHDQVRLMFSNQKTHDVTVKVHLSKPRRVVLPTGGIRSR